MSKDSPKTVKPDPKIVTPWFNQLTSDVMTSLIVSTTTQTRTAGCYAQVNGINMYYEIHGAGSPIVLLHGGGSTIHTNFSRVLPSLAQTHQVIAVELQAHGHTGDRDAPETFEQDADDVAELLRQLDIPQAHIVGFSNGGHTAFEIAIRHPKKVRKLILASTFFKREGVPADFWEGMAQAKFSDMPQLYKDAYTKINSDPAALMNMFNKDVRRMQTFQDWKEKAIGSIQAPTLIVLGDQDVVRPEHGVEMLRILSNSRLAILPGNHGSYMGEAASANPGSKVPELFVAVVEEFLTS